MDKRDKRKEKSEAIDEKAIEIDPAAGDGVLIAYDFSGKCHSVTH
jgi:hypothetical protein